MKKVYELKPRPMGKTDLFETVEGAKAAAQDMLNDWLEFALEHRDDPEDGYIMTTELEWNMETPRSDRSLGENRGKFFRQPDEFFKWERLTAWYCVDYAITITEREVLP